MFAALLLNASNYLFVRVYNAAHEITTKRLSSTKHRHHWADPKFWSAMVKCDKTNASCFNNSRTSNDNEMVTTTPPAFINIMMPRKRTTTVEKELENCPQLPPGLGPEVEDRSLLSMNFHYPIKAKMADVKTGGIYQPTHCKALQSVAVIIAYRGCKNCLSTFMNTLHTFLIKQQLDYQIFVVEQTNRSQPFNRGKLLNVGFTEATRYRKDGFHCIIFHEPHIVPVDSRNLYRCSWYPRQLAMLVERPVKAPYLPLIGGAIAITPEQFLKINGFSNAYWGNDADYYDLYNRINISNYNVESSLPHVGKYKTIRKGLGLWTKSQYLTTPSPLYLLDGLTSLSYTVDSSELRRLFTYMQVNIDAVVETKKRAEIYDKLLNPTTYQTTQQTNQDTTKFVVS
ncbi:hypothetical protein PYW07_005022 [Mythimna separata]|uniref:Beta-1,4-N-acetylgalactosaminyltransferase n=1 Tax=Mythimna separata TaxID=271217 RepID=A0AAD7YET0_MYTSE|nr:hypothetical protein PYW07_005022 [Mythimna separata]